jgi:hypothetical protein
MSFLLKIVVFHAIVPSCLHLHISSLSIGKCQYIWGYCENMTTIIQDEQYSKSHQSHHTIFIYVLHINYTIYIIPYNTILSYIYTCSWVILLLSHETHHIPSAPASRRCYCWWASCAFWLTSLGEKRKEPSDAMPFPEGRWRYWMILVGLPGLNIIYI